MSDEVKDACTGCSHDKEKHDVLKEPYGRLCIACVDDGSDDPCRQFSA